MSLFARTSAEVEAVETAAAELLASTSPLANRKEELDSLLTSLVSINAAVNKFVANADAGEADPNKRLYGATMVTKIRALKVRLDALNEDVASVEAKVNSDWEIHEAARIASEKEKMENERQRLEAERMQRLDDEEAQRRKLEAERLEREKEAERARLATEKLVAERADLERQEQLKLLAAKKEADEAEKSRQEKESAEASRALAEGERRANDHVTSAFSLTVKTSKGAVLAVGDISIDATVLDLKNFVERLHRIPVVSQRLIFQGRLLDNDKMLTEYKISQGVVVHLVENSKPPTSSASSSHPKPVVPPGTLRHLANGKLEYDAILASCGNERLAVFDFSAPWCGPCRVIAPVYERLAGRFADVTFVKVDTEETPANMQLAQELGISAYPTFHYYVGGQKVHEFSGANASQIEAGVRRFKPTPSATRSAAGASAASNLSGSTLTGRVMTALNSLKSSCSNDDFLIAVRTLLTFVRNITDHPTDDKYRKVRTGNTAYQTRLARHGERGIACMRAFGFEPHVENGEHFLIISEAAANHPELRAVKSQLEAAMQAAGIAVESAGRSAQQTHAPGPVPGAGADDFGAVGWGGRLPTMPPGMPMDPALMEELMTEPSFQRMAQEFTTNPEFLSLAMRLQAAIQSGDHAAVMQIASDPAMARVQQLMMTNPALMQRMTQHMGGAGGMPGFAQMMGGAGVPGMGTNVNRDGAGLFPLAGTTVGTAAGFATPTQPRTNLNPPAAPRHGPSPDPPLPANVPWPGAPTTEEEEERLLQEAIRLSMEESNKRDSNKDSSEGRPSDDNGGGGSA